MEKTAEMDNLEGKYLPKMRRFSCDDDEVNLEEKKKTKEEEEEEEEERQSYNDHYNPSVRLVRIFKSKLGISDTYGFHLTRSKWDPYPWVSAVDVATPAALGGLKAGDCILKVNDKDVLGLRVRDIAELLKAESESVTLLAWNPGMDGNCDPKSLCCAPLPLSLQRLSVIAESILSIIECPVCLSTISPPAMQCQNGHLLCVDCRIRAERCPVCRDRYTPRRALIAEQIYAAITNAFQMPHNSEKLRQKLFGTNTKIPQRRAEMREMNRPKGKWRADAQGLSTMRPRNKFFAKLWGKACSVHNLTTILGQEGTSGVETGGNVVASGGGGSGGVSDAEGSSLVAQSKTSSTFMDVAATNGTNAKTLSSNGLQSAAATTTTTTTLATIAASQIVPSSCMNSSLSTNNVRVFPEAAMATQTTRTTTITAQTSTFEHFSLSTNDLSLNSSVIAMRRRSSSPHQHQRCCTNGPTLKADARRVCSATRRPGPRLGPSSKSCSELPDESSLLFVDSDRRAWGSPNDTKNSNSFVGEWTVVPTSFASTSSSPSSVSSFATLASSSTTQTSSSKSSEKNDLSSATTKSASSFMSSTQHLRHDQNHQLQPTHNHRARHRQRHHVCSHL